MEVDRHWRCWMIPFDSHTNPRRDSSSVATQLLLGKHTNISLAYTVSLIVLRPLMGTHFPCMYCTGIFVYGVQEERERSRVASREERREWEKITPKLRILDTSSPTQNDQNGAQMTEKIG